MNSDQPTSREREPARPASSKWRWLWNGGALLRYLFVGAGTSLLDLGLFSALSVGLSVHPIAANVVSTIITICVSYVINRGFVFRSHTGFLRSFFSFAGLTLFTGLVLQTGVIVGVLWTAGLVVPTLPESVVLPAAKIVSMGVGAAANYVGYRLIFARGEASRSPDTVLNGPSPDGKNSQMGGTEGGSKTN